MTLDQSAARKRVEEAIMHAGNWRPLTPWADRANHLMTALADDLTAALDALSPSDEVVERMANKFVELRYTNIYPGIKLTPAEIQRIKIAMRAALTVLNSKDKT